MKAYKPLLSLLLCILCLLLSGCQRKKEPISGSAFLLNTFVTVTLYDSEDEDILNQCLQLCKDYELLFSKTIPSSEVYKLNHRSPEDTNITLSDHTASLIEKGLYYSRLSQGAFDITIEPLSTLWDFTADPPSLPRQEDISQALSAVGYQTIQLNGNTLTFLSETTTLDLGGIAKGYIADRIKEYLQSQGVQSAVINLGGNVLCVGAKPDGTPFKIGLQKPYESHSETVAALAITDLSVVSSGVYERHFVLDGTNYHHLLDPRTGYPYQNGLTAVTIISETSVDGDGLSTLCFSLGLEQGMALIDSLDDAFAILITEDGQLHYSQGARDFIVP